MDNHLIAYYIGIVLLLVLSAAPLVLPSHPLPVSARTRSFLLLIGTVLVMYQFTYANKYITW
jgi:hypothetical protein